MARQAPRPWSSIHSADRQLASTIIAPTDRSMPPEITITAWAMARKASAIVPAVIVRISKSPNCGSCEHAPQQQHDEQQPDADGPALTPGEARQPARRLRQAS